MMAIIDSKYQHIETQVEFVGDYRKFTYKMALKLNSLTQIYVEMS